LTKALKAVMFRRLLSACIPHAPARLYRQIAEEAYTTPQVIKEAPHHAALGSRIQEDGLTEWKKFATTWRAYIKMKKDS